MSSKKYALQEFSFNKEILTYGRSGYILIILLVLFMIEPYDIAIAP